MAGAYSTDRRSRVPTAVKASESPGAAARRFAVDRSTAYSWVAAARDEGGVGPSGWAVSRRRDPG